MLYYRLTHTANRYKTITTTEVAHTTIVCRTIYLVRLTSPLLMGVCICNKRKRRYIWCSGMLGVTGVGGGFPQRWGCIYVGYPVTPVTLNRVQKCNTFVIRLSCRCNTKCNTIVLHEDK